MGLQPLQLKRKENPNVIVQDEDEVPIRQEGPIIPGPVSVNIFKVHRRKMPKYSSWYINPPPGLDDVDFDWDNPNALPPGVAPRILNLVCTIDVGCQLDLKTISKTASNAVYNPGRFSACIVRIRSPKATGLMFSNGKMVVTGTHCELDSAFAAKEFVSILKQQGYQARFQGLMLQNIVASCNFKFGIALGALKTDPQYGADMTYEDDRTFTASVFKMPTPKICFFVYRTGRIVSTGVKVKFRRRSASQVLPGTNLLSLGWEFWESRKTSFRSL